VRDPNRRRIARVSRENDTLRILRFFRDRGLRLEFAEAMLDEATEFVDNLSEHIYQRLDETTEEGAGLWERLFFEPLRAANPEWFRPVDKPLNKQSG